VISAEPSAVPRLRGRVARLRGRVGDGQPGLRLRWALPVALAGGLLLAASFPPLGIWPLSVLGVALLTVALAGRSLRASFGCGLVFGVAFFFPLLSWVLNVWWFAWVALAGGSVAILAGFAVFQRLLLRLPGWPLAVAGWWVSLEALRDRFPFGGFPWGRLAMSQAAAPSAGWAAVGGAPVLSFVVALVGATLAWLILSAGARRSRRTLAAGVLAVAAAAGLAASGTLLPVDPTAGAQTSEVAAIQGNVPRARNLPAELNDTEVTENHSQATEKLAAQVKAGQRPAPDLVVWPENSTDLDPFSHPAIEQQITSALSAVGAPLLVGEVLNDPQLNVGQLWTPGQGPGAIYAKRQLVPFGEYIPWRGFVSQLTSLTDLVPTNFVPGHAAVVLKAGPIRLGDVICYEVGFDRLVRSEVTAGANLLTVQTNDADFEIDGQTGESEQQLAMARIRAVESDRAVVVASTTGVSAIIAPDGRLITHSGTWQQAVLEAKVPLITHRTWADDVGAGPEWVIVGLTGLALLAAAGTLTGRRRPRPATGSGR